MRQLRTIPGGRAHLVAFADERAEEERAKFAQATRDVDRLKAVIAARAFDEIASYGRTQRSWRSLLASLWGYVAATSLVGFVFWLWLITYATQ